MVMLCTWRFCCTCPVAPVPVYIHKDSKGTAPTTLRVLNSWKLSVLLPPVRVKCYDMLPE